MASGHKGRRPQREAREIQIYKCELCGSDVVAALADLYEVGGERHAFCSPDHRIEWLELEEAVAADRKVES